MRELSSTYFPLGLYDTLSEAQQLHYRLPSMADRAVTKDDLREDIGGDRGAFRKYQDFFVGTRDLGSLIKYELAQLFACHIPGAPGYVLRKLLMTPLLGRVGDGVQIGKGVVVRHPDKIFIGEQTAVDDQCVLDARGVEKGDFRIGAEVLIARGTALTSKTDHGAIMIGDHSTIGKNCILSSSGGIQIGKWVGIAGDCYIGGGRYRTDRTDVPMMKQELYTEGPVVIGDDCWIGAGARVLDGVEIGRGSIIGAGAVVREDVPEYTMVTPNQQSVRIPRAVGGETKPSDSSDPQDRDSEDLKPNHKSLQDSVYRAIDTLNQALPPEKHLAKSPETSLRGLDSINKVNLIVETEMKVEEEFGEAINLADDIEGEGSEVSGADLFETISSFTKYVESQLDR